MSNKKDTIRQQRELARYRDTLVHAACGFIRVQEQEQLQPGVILQMHFDSRFKTHVTWHIPDEAGKLILPVTFNRKEAANHRHYVIKRAQTRLSYLWCRFRLGEGLFLRAIPHAEELPTARLVLKREYIFDPLAA